MDEHKFRYTSGIWTGASLVLAGIILQATLGEIKWDILTWPLNIIVLAVYLVLLPILYRDRKKYRAVRWLESTRSATTSMAYVALATVIMGLIRQGDITGRSFPGLHHLTANWSFFLLYLWMTTSLGMAILSVVNHFRPSKIPFLLSHVGLFIALTAGVAGSPDRSVWQMKAFLGQPTDSAMDTRGYTYHTPFTLTLESFDMQEYEPVLMVVDCRTGEYVPAGRPASLTLTEDTRLGSLNGWDICVLGISDSTGVGSCARALITASRPGRESVQGEVSCGSFMHEPEFLMLDDGTCIVMPERDPSSFVSKVRLSDGGGEKSYSISVNKPCRNGSWRIYQKNYDHHMGRWSEYSILEIVHDPWAPVVYIGILMMLLGAICMFFKL